MIDTIADLLLFPIAAFTWRLSKAVSCSLQLAIVGAVALRLGIEEARVVSAFTGLAGALDMGLVLDNPTHADRDMRRLWIGSILIVSMVIDFVALSIHRLDGTWVMPAFQIAALLVIGWICLKGESR